MIQLKSEKDIEKIRESGRLLAEMFEKIGPEIKEGISTYDIDKMFESMMREKNVKGPCKGYYGYPSVTCISVNDTVIHGIPSKKIILKDGDIVSVDVVISKDGYFSDSTHTYEIGKVSEAIHNLNVITKECLYLGIEAAGKKDARLVDIARAIQNHAEKHGYGVVRDYTGHGVGFEMHEEPEVLNYVNHFHPNTRLREGTVIAIEPMINMGTWKVVTEGWNVRTLDGKPACHWEHTIAITNSGVEIMTDL